MSHVNKLTGKEKPEQPLILTPAVSLTLFGSGKSNIDPVEEMTKVIKAQRDFERHCAEERIKHLMESAGKELLSQSMKL